MAHEDESGSRFVVDLGKVKLPPLAEKQVEAEIQAVVLRALAESDVSGKQRIPIPDIRDQFPEGLFGLWIGPQDQPPFISGSGGTPVPLTAKDHTLIMRAIMENPFELLRYLPSKYKSKNGPRPSGGEVLQAALQVERIDDHVKDRIRAVLDFLPKIEEGKAALPESVKRIVEDLRQQMAYKTVEEKRSMFRDAGLRSRRRDDGLADGMEVAARILEDGQGSIYSPDHIFHKLVPGGRESSDATAEGSTAGEAGGSLSELADVDGIGATVGGGVGAVVGGGIGAAPGAVAGGVGASGGYAIMWVIDAIF